MLGSDETLPDKTEMRFGKLLEPQAVTEIVKWPLFLEPRRVRPRLRSGWKARGPQLVVGGKPPVGLAALRRHKVRAPEVTEKDSGLPAKRVQVPKEVVHQLQPLPHSRVLRPPLSKKRPRKRTVVLCQPPVAVQVRLTKPVAKAQPI